MTAVALPTVTVDELLRAQGADPARLGARHAALAAIAEEALEAGAAAVSPGVTWSWREVRGVHPGRVLLGGAGPLRHAALAEGLAGASRVAAAALTLGPGLERLVVSHVMGRPSLALALDAYGSTVLLRLGTEARLAIAAEAAADGLAMGPSLFPGMPGWPVVPGQAELLGLLDAPPDGLTLTELGMLVPGKSLTFLVGAGSGLAPGGAPCDGCEASPRCSHRA